MLDYSEKDLQQWEEIFEGVPVEWKTHPPTEHQLDCMKFLHDHKVRTILDSGCGIGRWAIHLAKNGFIVSGYDFSENAISYACNWAEDEKLKMRFAVSELTRDPFPNESFDAHVSAMVIHNISKPELEVCLSILYEKLNQGGVFFLLVNPFLTEELAKIQENSDNPTKGITQINYTDQELKDLFPGYELVNFKTYKDGTRGIFLLK